MHDRPGAGRWGAVLAMTLVCGDVALLGGCSKEAKLPERQRSDAAAAPPASTGRPRSARPLPSVEERHLPQPEPATPDEDYVALTSGGQLLFLYNAFSGLPPDYEKLASEYSSEYAGTSDGFRKHDLLEALEPKLAAQIAQAKEHPYIRWDSPSTRLDHYDFERKGFPLKDALLEDGGYGYMNDIRGYNIAFTHGADVDFLPVADEAQARAIESMLQQMNPAIRLYGFVQTADDRGGRTVRARVMKVQILDRNGRLLLERKAGR